MFAGDDGRRGVRLRVKVVACEQGFKFEARKDVAQHGGKGVDKFAVVERKSVQRHVGVDFGEFVRQVRVVLVRNELVVPTAGNYVYVRIDFVERTVCGNKLDRGLVAYARNPGNIVRAVARKRFEIDDAVGGDPEHIGHRFGRNVQNFGYAFFSEQCVR